MGARLAHEVPRFTPLGGGPLYPTSNLVYDHIGVRTREPPEVGGVVSI
jgi:hypothetical protein